jgi:malate dehydrogenase
MWAAVSTAGLIERNYDSLIVITSNPAEFAVDTFVDAGFNPARVMGFGAYLDTMRFRRELASELGVSRQLVSGFCLGMHGLSVVPCWSTVQLSSICADHAMERLEQLKEEGLSRMPRDVAALREVAYEIRNLAESHKPLAAAGLVNLQPPDARASLRRYLSFFSGPTYPRVGIGEKVSRLIGDILNGRETLVAAQVYCDDWMGIKDQSIGAPVLLSSQGVRITKSLQLHQKEIEAVKDAAEKVASLSSAMKTIRALRKARKKSGKR